MANLKTKQHDYARYLYFHTDKTYHYIAASVGVSKRTICTWVNEGNWKELKKSQYNSPDEEIQQLYDELRAISVRIRERDPKDRIPTQEELDTRKKILTLLKDLDKAPGAWRNIPTDEAPAPSDRDD